MSPQIRKTSIIILTWNQLPLTRGCLASLKAYTDPKEYELIIVDNGSTDATRNFLVEECKDARVVLNDRNAGFPGGCNLGYQVASRDTDILLLNNDVLLTRNWLSKLRGHLYSADSIGAVGPVSNSVSNAQQISVPYKERFTWEEVARFGEDYNCQSKPLERRGMLVGFCMLIKNETVNEVTSLGESLLDERFYPGNFEDNDLAVRIQLAGYSLGLCVDTFIHHHGSATWRSAQNLVSQFNETMRANYKKFEEKWGFPSDATYLPSFGKFLQRKFDVSVRK
jgi:O-antigen biosynthesis protein